MKKLNRYRYLGKNGIITTSVLLEGNKPIYMYRLIADDGKMLTDGERTVLQVEVFADEVKNWTEIDAPNKGQ